MQEKNKTTILVIAHSFIEKSGVEVYIENLFNELAKYPDIKILLVVNNISKSYYNIEGSNVKIVQPSRILNNQIGKILWYLGPVHLFARRNNINVLFNPSGGNTFVLKYRIPIITVIQDLAEYYVDDKYSRLRMFYRKHICLKINKVMSSSFISPTRSTKEDLIKYLKIASDNISVVHDGADHYKSQDVSSKAQTGSYFLYVGRIDPYGKNVLRLIQAFNHFQKNGNSGQLYLIGNKARGWDIVVKEIAALNLDDKIKVWGYVSRDQLSELYRNAIAFVFPSLYEGFGFPILEAMIYGIPVACSNTSCLPEIAGNAALYFNPLSIEDISKKMEDLSNNSYLRNELITKGQVQVKNFRWGNTAKVTKNLIEKELDRL